MSDKRQADLLALANLDGSGLQRPVHDVELRQSPKRILIYGINYAPEPIGVGRYSGELGSFLARQGHFVDVVTAIPHYPGWVARNEYRNIYSIDCSTGMRITRCPLFLRSEMRGLWRIIAPLSFAVTSAPIAVWRILTTRPDVVLCVEPTLFSSPIAILFSKIVGSRIVLHVQDLEIDAAFAVGHMKSSWLKKFVSVFERLLLPRFNHVVTISNRMREKLLSKGIASENMSVVRNWVDLDQIRPMDRRSFYRDDLGIGDDVFVVLYSGNIGKKQALHVLGKAARKLARNEGLAFVIAGDGPEKNELMSRYGDLENLYFLPVQPEESLCELLNLADVHVLPQDAEAADLVLPSKLGGMLASGKPCIVMASPETELYDFLDGSVILIPPGDTDALASALVSMRKTGADETRESRLRAVGKLRADDNLKLFSTLLF